MGFAQELLQATERARGRAGEFWGRLGPGRKVAVVAAGTMAIALLALFLLWARTPSYSVLYPNLTEEEAGAVVAKLKETKVPYEIRGDGAILVPTEQVRDVRLQLAAEGLVKGGGVGYELFDQTNFGLTDFAQKINYQRALEGELSRTINRLDAVEESRVHIVIPQPTLYTDNKVEPTASVVLRLRPGRQLTRAQLRGVTQLIAGSVEALKPENVTIVDTRGTVLSEVTSPDGSDPTASLTKASVQRAYEAQIENNLQSLLNHVLGPDRATVQVSAALDWDKVESNSEVFSPDGQPPQVRSQRELSETYPPGGMGPSGIPGVDSNVPTYQEMPRVATPAVAATATAGGTPSATVTATTTPGVAATPVGAELTRAGSGGQRKESTVNYELSRKTEHVVRAQGGVKRLSVAVVVDSSVVATEQVEALRQVVSAAAGLDPARGDVLTVTPIPFDKTNNQAAGEAAEQQKLILSIARIVATALGPLLLLVFLWLILRRPRRRVGVAEIGPARLPLLAAAMAETSSGLAGSGQIPEAESLVQLPSAEDQRRAKMRRQIVELVRENPATVAQLMQTWLEEDK